MIYIVLCDLRFFYSPFFYSNTIACLFVMVIEGGKDVTNLQIDQLMKKISQKDSSALEALYKAMSKPIYFYVLHLTGNPHIAEDVMQDTFVIVLQKRNKNGYGYHTGGQQCKCYCGYTERKRGYIKQAFVQA